MDIPQLKYIYLNVRLKQTLEKIAIFKKFYERKMKPSTILRLTYLVKGVTHI